MSNEPSGAPPSQQEKGPKLWLSGPLRHAATILFVVVILASLVVAYRGATHVPLPPDTGANLRPAGAEIPVYRGALGEERFHLLKPGDHVDVGDVLRARSGTRVPIHFVVDGQSAEGYIEERDIVPEDLARAKAALEAAGRR